MSIENLTAILVFITAVYVYLTYKIMKVSTESVEAMREQSEAMLRPYITIEPFIRPHTPILYLRIKNTGKTTAENLKLTLDRDFYKYGENNNEENNLRSLNVFKTPINHFPPNSELFFALGQAWVIFDKDPYSDITPLKFQITAKYSFFKKNIEEINKIDLTPYLGSEGMLNPIVEELKKIREAIEKKTNLYNGL